MQKIIDLGISNSLWENSSYYAEEQLSGLQVTFKVTKTMNTLEAGYQKIHHAFHEYRDLSLYKDLKETTFSAVLIAPEGLGRRYLKTLIDSGVMGAERLQRENGNVRLVLTDIFELGGVDLSGLEFKDRRIYLESLTSLLIEKSLVPKIVISDIIKTNKKQFFEFICSQGARGVILKNALGLAHEDLYKISSKYASAGVGNITLNKNWQELDKKIEPLENFNYDTFLAVQFLNSPINELKLSTLI